MLTSYDFEAAAEEARDTSRKTIAQFEALGLDTAVPEAVRALATTAVTQTREAYERSTSALEAGLEALGRSFDVVGHTAVALNRKVIDIAQRNVDSSFDLAKSLAAAKNLADILDLQAAYSRKQFGLLMAQAEEIRALSTEVTAGMAEPIKQHATHQAEEARVPSAEVTGDAAEPIKRRATHSAEEQRKAS